MIAKVAVSVAYLETAALLASALEARRWRIGRITGRTIRPIRSCRGVRQQESLGCGYRNELHTRSS